jgi:hypothetical protein
VSLVIETLDVMVTVPVLLSWRRFGVTPLASHRMWSSEAGNEDQTDSVAGAACRAATNLPAASSSVSCNSCPPG